MAKFTRSEILTVALFLLIHLAALGVFFVPFRWELAAWLAGSYGLRMFAITAGYHRYFSHRSYKLGRVAQFLLAFLAQTSGQKGVLWWERGDSIRRTVAVTIGSWPCSPWGRVGTTTTTSI